MLQYISEHITLIVAAIVIVVGGVFVYVNKTKMVKFAEDHKSEIETVEHIANTVKSLVDILESGNQKDKEIADKIFEVVKLATSFLEGVTDDKNQYTDHVYSAVSQALKLVGISIDDEVKLQILRAINVVFEGKNT